MNPADMDAIALVAALRHRIDTRRTCRCEECRALKRVVVLAREAVVMKETRKRSLREREA